MSNNYHQLITFSVEVTLVVKTEKWRPKTAKQGNHCWKQPQNEKVYDFLSVMC